MILFYFYFLDRTRYKVFKQSKTDLEILMDLHVLMVTEFKKVIFGMSFVCVHYNSKNN